MGKCLAFRWDFCASFEENSHEFTIDVGYITMGLWDNMGSYLYYKNCRYIEVIYRKMEETMGRYRKNIIFLWMFFTGKDRTPIFNWRFSWEKFVFFCNDQQFAMVSIVFSRIAMGKSSNQPLLPWVPSIAAIIFTSSDGPCFLSQESRGHPNPFHLVDYPLVI